jgi:hypothetical protein
MRFINGCEMSKRLRMNCSQNGRKNLKEISSANLRDDSRNKLRETRRRYEELHGAPKRAGREHGPGFATVS